MRNLKYRPEVEWPPTTPEPKRTAAPEINGVAAKALAPAPVPLVVGLNGTLVLGDLLPESVIALLKRSLHWVLFIPLWLLKGPAAFKAELTRRLELDTSTILFNHSFVEYLKQERALGRRIVLVTSTHETWAHRMAEAVDVFDAVLASTETRNLTPHEKLQALCERFGSKGFDYAGSSAADYPIWQAARRATLVNASPRVARWAAKNASVEHVFPRKSIEFVTYLRALRIHQWLKNLLLFAPLVAAAQVTDVEKVVQLCIGFLAFSLCASSVYVLNDVVDVHDDRGHPRKRRRPLASGELSLSQALALIPALLGMAVLFALLLPWEFGAVLAAYYATTVAYTFKLKQLEIIDVLTLALLYTTRVFAGAAAVGIPLSFWLLGFATFIFLSLALVKRCTELVGLREGGENSAPGRGYRVTDLPLLYSMGTGSGYVAALILGLYIESVDVEQIYARPVFLWVLVPLVIYWITRMWLKTFRGEMHDDPVIFAARDPASVTLALVSGIALWLAI